MSKGSLLFRSFSTKSAQENWKDLQFQRKFLDQVGTKLSIRNHEDWYKVTKAQIVALGGHELLDRYNNSFQKMLMAVYPEVQWQYRFTPRNYWKDKQNQKDFFLEVQRKLNVQSMEDWYNVTVEQVAELGGRGILKHFGRSLPKALQAVFPKYHWEMHRFSSVGGNYWLNLEHQREAFLSFQTKLGIKTPEDWHSVTSKQIHQLGGGGLLTKYYGNSVPKALKAIFPEVQWDMVQFKRSPKGNWTDIEKQRAFFEGIESKLEIRTHEDWYRVTAEQVARLGGRVLLRSYKNSLHAALKAVYPDFDWKPWKFPQVSKGYWDDMNNRQKFLDDFERQHHIHHRDNWKNITLQELSNAGGLHLYKKFKNIRSVVQNTFPSISLSNWNNVANKREYHMIRTIRDIFPDHIVYNDVHSKDMLYKSGRSVQLDAYIFNLAIAFEYQGEQHYGASPYKRVKTETLQERDEAKRKLCKQYGVTLIEVPYWWNGTKQQLEATIALYRPDLLTERQGEPIPSRYEIQKREMYSCKDDYIVAYHKNGRPKCRGCGEVIAPDVLRIIARGTFVDTNATFATHICLKSSCLQDALAKQTSTKLPPFKNTIKVPEDIKARLELPKLEGIVWT